MPCAGSRPAGTSQKLRTVLIPMPMSDGHFTSGVTVLSGTGGAAFADFAAAFFGARRDWAAAGTPASMAAMSTGVRRRILTVYSLQFAVHSLDDVVQLAYAIGPSFWT